jgi:hypothetical protein
MDYKNVLQEQLLSETNIDFLVSAILANFKISNKAISKCINIITNNMIKYIELIDKYPESNNQLVEAINYLNKKCYDDFTVYLLTKYPNGNILRNNTTTQTNISQQASTELPWSSGRSFDLSNIRSPHQIQPIQQMQQMQQMQQIQPSQQIIPQQIIPQQNEIIILTEEQKNELLKKYEKNLSKPVTNETTKTDEFLSYLTNPLVLQMFNMMVNQMNQQYTNHKTMSKDKPSEIIVDEILDINQVQDLIAKSNKEHVRSNKVVATAQDDIPEEIPEEVPEEIPEENAEENTLVDLENLNNESVILAEKKIKELVGLKNKYLEKKDIKMVKQLDEEKTNILNAVITYKQKSKKEAKENENKINSITLSNTKDPNGQNNIELLNLQFDPTNDYTDLKNIVIGFKAESKIGEISLISYYLPFNTNNVTRFNNKIVVYFNSRINKFTIPPGKYEINVLLDAIKNQANFLDFSINEKNKIITIKNKISMKFDLIIDNDTVFPLLGFIGKNDTYKDKLFYEASQSYNLDINQKVFLSLTGSTKDPCELEFNKEVSPTQPIVLKKMSRGVSMKQMTLKLTNNIGQYYDFVVPFKMCFKISYVV